MLTECWPTVCDAGPTYSQHWLNDSWLPGCQGIPTGACLISDSMCKRRSLAIIRQQPNAVLKLVHRRRWWTSFYPPLGLRICFLWATLSVESSSPRDLNWDSYGSAMRCVCGSVMRIRLRTRMATHVTEEIASSNLGIYLILAAERSEPGYMKGHHPDGVLSVINSWEERAPILKGPYPPWGFMRD